MRGNSSVGAGVFAALLAMFLVGTAFLPMRAGIGSGSFAVSTSLVFAEDDDEDEDEDEEDDEDRDEDEDDEKPKKETITVTRYETRVITQIVTVLPEEYKRDTDGDGLVDGVDPDPRVHQNEYFTDTDGDAIPNVFDRHHDEDDFAYYDGEEDADGNGILDSYERLAER